MLLSAKSLVNGIARYIDLGGMEVRPQYPLAHVRACALCPSLSGSRSACETHYILADRETYDLYGAETAAKTSISRFAARRSENNSQRYGICSFGLTRTK